jgi:ribosomal protein S1
MSPTDHDPSKKKSLDDELEREIAEALGGESLLGIDAPPATTSRSRGAIDRLLEKAAGSASAPGSPATGMRTGRVTHVGRDDVFLEFGPREQGVVPLAHFSDNPEVGATLKVHVDGFDAKEGLLLCSLKRGVQSAEWDTLETGSILMAQVLAANKGGLDLKVGSLSAFLPASQASLERIEKLETLIGQSFAVEVLDVDRERRRIVVSRRGLLAREREEKRQGAVKALIPGTTLSGKVTKVEPFGCFVDLGGVEGLVHVSQMAWTRVEKPEEIVKAGDPVKVQVLDVSEDGRRISLSMRALQTDPWVTWTAEHPVGSQVEGTVTRLAPYGGFVEIAPGLEGLAHVSQLSPHQVRSAKEVLHVGQKVTVRVAQIDPAQRRIGLSLLTERGDRLTDDVADTATIREVLSKSRASAPEPTLGDLLKRALEQKRK